MKGANEYNWAERSLSYLCRAYDQLHSGDEYTDVLPVVHISFLDFILHPSHPEFYATYQMMNVKNHLVYSDKFKLSVVNLKCIELATVEDKKYQIDYWAALFKAKTWKELRMVVKDNEFLQEAAESLYVLNADEIARQHCIAREDAERRECTLERKVRLAEEALKEKDKEIEQKDSEIEENRKEIQRLKELLSQNGLEME